MCKWLSDRREKMKVPIRVDDVEREARIYYITPPDFGFLQQWRNSLGADQNPIRRDAVVFATLACKRFTAHSRLEIYARDAQDISDHIRNNPRCEVANLVAIECRWFPDSDVMGLAHFRRSWSNNLILDYLAVHPWICKPPVGYPHVIRRVGTALLYFLGHVGCENRCGRIWGEATQNSYGFYQKAFDLESVSDLVYIPADKFVEFVKNLEQKWKLDDR